MNTIHPYWLVIISIAVAAVPVVVGLVTSYVKVNIVLNMLKSGLGAQQVPGSLVVMALSFALTLQIMGPVIRETAEQGKGIELNQMFSAPNLSKLSNLSPLITPWKDFMLLHSGKRELQTLSVINEKQIAHEETKVLKENTQSTPNNAEAEPPLSTIIPAFVLTELKEAFAMGFVILLPFLVIDLIVSNVLVGMGMMMVSPMMISLPLKILIFVMADGWILLARGLVHSYHV